MCYIGLGEVVHVYATKAYGGVQLFLHPFFNPSTYYGLDGSGTEFRWGEIFRTLKAAVGGPPSLLHNGYWVSFPGVKRPGRGVDRPSHLAPKLKSWAVLLLPLWAFIACSRAKFTIINLGTTWKWIISFTPRPVYPREKSEWYPLKRKLRGLRNQSGHFAERKSVACTGNQSTIPRFFGPWPRHYLSRYNGLVVELTGCSSSNAQGISHVFRLKYTPRRADCENKKEEFTAPWMWGLVSDSVMLCNTHNTNIRVAWGIQLYRVYKNYVCMF
jgi:hypothetical protein